MMTTTAIPGFNFPLVIAIAVPLVYGHHAVRVTMPGVCTFFPLRVERAVLVEFMMYHLCCDRLARLVFSGRRCT